jgi:NitT/TauT family transport system substrate-binding protein
MNKESSRGCLWQWKITLFLLAASSGFHFTDICAAEKSGERPLQKIRVAYSSISGNMLPAWVAYEKGFFRKYGLDVQLLFIDGGSRVVQTLVSGDVTAAQMAGSAVIQSHLEGSGVKIIAGFVNTMTYKLMVTKDISNPEQLRGKILAVSRFGSSSDFATRYALDKYGLVVERDVTLVQIGSEPARMAALASGKIQGSMVNIPVTAQATKLGFTTLADLQMLGLEYQHTGLAVTQTLISSQPDLVRNLMKAFVEAIAYYKTHRKESMAILQKYLKSDDLAALEETYESIGLTLIPEKPYPTLKGIQIMLQELAAKNPKAEAAKAEQFVDLTFIKELDNSGFINRLYKPGPAVASRETTRPSPAANVTEKSPLEDKTKLASQPTPVAEAKNKLTAASANDVRPKTSSVATTAVEEYTVKAGDHLSKLAEQFYGAQWKWGKIYEANKRTMNNPHFLYIGQKILIPPDNRVGT